jgi:hypothetical protein
MTLEICERKAGFQFIREVNQQEQHPQGLICGVSSEDFLKIPTIKKRFGRANWADGRADELCSVDRNQGFAPLAPPERACQFRQQRLIFTPRNTIHNDS